MKIPKIIYCRKTYEDHEHSPEIFNLSSGCSMILKFCTALNSSVFVKIHTVNEKEKMAVNNIKYTFLFFISRQS